MLTKAEGFNQTARGEDTTDIWLTPRALVEALGPFDLDPCAAPDPRPWPTAARHYTEAEGDGLTRPWDGFVWLNPPYGSQTFDWMDKLAAHPGGGVALTFARTETKGFHRAVWEKATGILFIKGRLKFCRPDGTTGGTAGAPSVLVAYGEEAFLRLDRWNGARVRLRSL